MPQYELNTWYPLQLEDDKFVLPPEMRLLLMKNDTVAHSFHLGVIHDGNFHELDSRLQKYKRRYDFSAWNAWGNGFPDKRYSPTHFMLLE